MLKKLALVLILVIGFLAFNIYSNSDKYFYSLQRRLEFFKEPVEKNDKPFDYTLVFAGDSMTEYLGNFDEMQKYLQNYYPGKKFLLLNYGYGSTSILSLQGRLEKDSTYSGRLFQAINEIPFDLILIESFGHNPLSEYSLQDGLKKQTESLDRVMESIVQKHPKSSVVFIATIAPNKYTYAYRAVELSSEVREKWVAEREAYIKNHIKYAKDHSIPIINVYEKSLKDGTGNGDYISDKDYIHPSPTGIYFISETIADFLGKEKFLK